MEEDPKAAAPSADVVLDTPPSELVPDFSTDGANLQTVSKWELCALTSDDALVRCSHYLLGEAVFGENCENKSEAVELIKEASAKLRTLYLMKLKDRMQPTYCIYFKVEVKKRKHASTKDTWSFYKCSKRTIVFDEANSTNNTFNQIFDHNFIKAYRKMEEAGIRITWKAETNGSLICRLYILKSVIFQTFFQSCKKITFLCRKNIPYFLNSILMHFLEKYPAKKKLPWIDTCNSVSQGQLPASVDLDFDTFFNLLAKRAKADTDTPRYFLNEANLRVSLMEFQKKTIKWMIHREVSPALNCYNLFENYVLPLDPRSPNEQVFYFPYFGAFTQSDVIDYSFMSLCGGFLADEMGLGKTIDVLALINAHRKDETPRVLGSNEVEEHCSSLEQKKMTDEDWKKIKSSKTCVRTRGTTVIFTPLDEHSKIAREVSGRPIEAETLLNCSSCDTVCVKEKCHWDEKFEKEYGPFECPACFDLKDPLKVKTTLIVLPNSLVVQWYNQIENVCPPDFKVMLYNGMKTNGYIHPYQIAEHDILITTFECLRKELDFVRDGSLFQTKPRNGNQLHKFSPSPLTHISWWRIVIDESQTAEKSSRKVPSMCSIMKTNSFWCVTGTPFVNSVNDFLHLQNFLSVWPLSVDEFWTSYAYPDYRAKSFTKNKLLDDSDENMGILVDLVSQVMRRNTKESVKDEVALPELKTHKHMIRFSAIEERQYADVINRLKDNVAKALGNQPDNLYVHQVKSKDKVMTSLCRLREALISCGEHSNFSESRISSKRLNETVLYGPETIMLRLIRQKKILIEEYFRHALSAACAAGCIEIMIKNYQRGVEVYKEALGQMTFIAETNKLVTDMMKIEAENVEDDVSIVNEMNYEDGTQADIDFGKKRLAVDSKKEEIRLMVIRFIHELKKFRYKGGARETFLKAICSGNREEEEEKEKESEEQADLDGSLKENQNEQGVSAQPEKAGNGDKNAEKNDKDEEPTPAKRMRFEQDTTVEIVDETTEQDEGAETPDNQDTRDVLNEVLQEKMDKANKVIEKQLKELGRRTMRPIRLDSTMHSYLVMHLKELTVNPEIKELAEEFIGKYGGVEQLKKEFFGAAGRYVQYEKSGMKLIQSEWKIWNLAWENSGNEIRSVFDYLESLSDSYKFDAHENPKYDLKNKILASERTNAIVKKLPFLPHYVRSKRHLVLLKEREDAKRKSIKHGKTPRSNRQIGHDVGKCMGFCEPFTMETFVGIEKEATTLQMLQNYMRQVNRMEEYKKEAFDEFQQLLELFFKVTLDDFFLCLKEVTPDMAINEMRDMLYCKHAALDAEKDSIIIDESFQRSKCKLCKASAKIALFQFEAGFGSIHGVLNKKSALYDFLRLITDFERRSNSDVQAKDMLPMFRAYFERLGRTLHFLNMSIQIALEYSNRLREMDSARYDIAEKSIEYRAKRCYRGPPTNLSKLEMSELAKESYYNDYLEKSAKLRKSAHEIRYLVNLFVAERSGGTNVENNCTICGTFMEVLVVFPCGHRICDSCYRQLRVTNGARNISSNGRENVECVSCRGNFLTKTILIAKAQKDTQSVIPGITLSAKMEKTITLINELTKQDDTNKIILFSNIDVLTPIWKFLIAVLKQAGISFIEATRYEFGKKVYEFCEKPEIKVFLCSMALCSSGLNLTIANHIIFLDPCHLGSYVDQAIGRISRYGQKREMHIHHMIVESSIDESIKNMADVRSPDRETHGLTLGDIRQIFGIRLEDPEPERLDFDRRMFELREM